MSLSWTKGLSNNDHDERFSNSYIEPTFLAYHQCSRESIRIHMEVDTGSQPRRKIIQGIRAGLSGFWVKENDRGRFLHSYVGVEGLVCLFCTY